MSKITYSLSEEEIHKIIEKLKVEWNIEYINGPFMCEYMDCAIGFHPVNWDECCKVLQVAKWCEENDKKRFNTKVIARKN